MQLEVDRILETDKEEQTGRKPGGWQKHLKQFWWAYIVLLIVGVALIAPLVWLLSSSLKDEGKIFTIPPVWIPNPVRWSNYLTVFERIPFARFYWISAVVTFFSTAGNVVSASLVAFGFARMRFPGRNALFIVLLATVMI